MNVHLITSKAPKALVLAALILLAGYLPLTYAQGAAESEPNQPCTSAQDFGPVTLPFTVDGSLDSTTESPDIDFFKFSGTPGAWVTIDLQGMSSGKGSLENPLLGVFDSACNWINYNDDGTTLDSRLVMAVPEDGVFILAATACCDYDFIGGGIGTYQLTVAPLVQVGSISGRIVDAVTGSPLPGDVAPFAYATLVRCELGNCDIYVNSQSANNEGRFRFVSDSNVPLTVGTYQIMGSAGQYTPSQTDPFAVAENENRDIGDIRLQPFPVQTSDLQPCVNLPSAGGTCSYSVRVKNNSTSVIQGAAWSTVTGPSSIGSLFPSTLFQTAVPKPITLPPGSSKVVQFDFQVPSTVRDGLLICPTIYIGQDRPQPFFNVVGRTPRFCIRKSGTAAFSVVPQKQVEKMFRQADVQMLTPPKVK